MSRVARDLRGLGVVLFTGAIAWMVFGTATFFFASLALAFLLLLVLHQRAAKLSGDAVRALADFCLLTPWTMIVFPWWRL